MQRYTPEIIPSITHVKRGNKHLLIHPDKPSALMLNHTGVEIYQLCDGSNSIKDIAETISTRYGQPYVHVYQDVLSFVKRLEETAFFLSSDRAKEGGSSLPKMEGICLNLTERCDLRCLHCGVINKQSMKELSTERIIRLINETVAMGGEKIFITGGEPLLRKGCLFILKYAASKLKTTLLTNAVRISPKMARSIVDMGIKVQVSLDGATPDTHDFIRGQGAYLKTMKGIEQLKKNGVGSRLSLRVTLMKVNIGDLKNMLRLARRMEINQVRLTPVVKLGRARSNWEKLALSSMDYDFLFREILRSLKNTGKSEKLPRITWGCSGLNLHPRADRMECGIGRTITIDASGDVFPCTLMMRPAFRLGNIHDMRLEDISQSTELKALYHTCLYRKETVRKCSKCLWRHFCQGGCPASVYASTGSLKLTDNLCQMRHIFYMKAFLGSK